MRSQHRFRSDHHKVYTEEVNKKALSCNDDRRIQAFDKVTTYPYGTNVFMLCENEMLLKKMLNKTRTVRDEAKTLRANSLILRNELKELRRASHDIKAKSFILRKESQMLRKSDNNKTVIRDNGIRLTKSKD